MQQHSLQQWEVAEDYEIIRCGAEPVVTAAGSRLKFYPPSECPELPARLADLKEGDTDAALAFVRKWGLLGYRVLFRATASTLEEDSREQKRLGAWGDPLSWIWAHAETVRLTLRLIALLTEGRPDRVEDYLTSIADQDEDGRYYHAAGIRPVYSTVLMRGIQGRPLTGAAHLLTSILNRNIEYIHPRFVVYNSDTGELARSYSFKTLISVIYNHLGDAAQGRIGYYQCAYRGCDKWWPPGEIRRGRKRRYCPPDTPAAESLCSRKERYYRSSEQGARQRATFKNDSGQ